MRVTRGSGVTMTDTAKKRLAIDLDEIERQLRQTAPQYPAPQQPAPQNSAQRGDPLAELARIVGQEDPFRAILSEDRGGAAPRRGGQEADDIFVHGQDGFARGQHGRSTAGGAYDAQFYGDGDHAPAQPRRDDHEPFYQDPVQHQSFDQYVDAAGDPRHRQAQQDAYADDIYADPPYANETAYRRQEEWREPEPYADPTQYDDRYDGVAHGRTPPPRSRKAMLTVGAVLGVAVLGVASALVFSSGSGMMDGEPPLITADAEPLKIAPENPGGVEIPNQDRQIFGARDGETRIVDREEQPVDIREVAREAPRVILPPPSGLQQRAENDPINRVLAGLQPAEGLQAPSSVSAAAAALGEPRRVRTVSVRPDGTIIARPSAGQTAQAPSRPVTEAASTRQFQSTASLPVAPPQVSNDPAPPVPITPVAQTQPAAPVQPAAPAQPAVPEQAPLPQAQPAAPAPLTLTGALPPPPPRETPREVAAIPAAPAAPAVSQTGGYAVQLAIRDTEDRAMQAFSQYRARYSGIIGNVEPIIRRAEVNGNTIYRIRVGPYALGEANTICERIKGSGGDCFVARN